MIKIIIISVSKIITLFPIDKTISNLISYKLRF
jgi:hypothetical protein